MKFLHAAIVTLGIVLLAGCSIHPLPDEVTRLPTNQIVRHIRCEARNAIKDNLLQFLEVSTPDDREIARKIKDNEIPFSTVNDTLFKGYSKEIFDEFQRSGIAYDFTFDITENENIDPAFTLLDIFSKHGKLTVGGGVTFDRSRQSIRQFTIYDTFIKLVTLEGAGDAKSYCPDNSIQQANWVYPIAGSVGLGESLHQFVTMALFDRLSKQGDSSGPATMVDNLVFKTTLSATATPKVTLTPVGSGVHLMDAQLGLTAGRVDMHRLNLAFALPATPKADTATVPTRTAPSQTSAPLAPTLADKGVPNAPLVLPTQLPREVLGSGVRSGLFVNAAGASPGELLAAQALDQSILRFEVGRSGTAVIPIP